MFWPEFLSLFPHKYRSSSTTIGVPAAPRNPPSNGSNSQQYHSSAFVPSTVELNCVSEDALLNNQTSVSTASLLGKNGSLRFAVQVWSQLLNDATVLLPVWSVYAHERRQEQPRFGFCCPLTCQWDSRGFGGEFRGLAPCKTDLLDFALMWKALHVAVVPVSCRLSRSPQPLLVPCQFKNDPLLL